LIVVDVDVITVNVVSTGIVPEFGNADSSVIDEELACSGSIREDLRKKQMTFLSLIMKKFT
jgi:hypothetical protein